MNTLKGIFLGLVCGGLAQAQSDFAVSSSDIRPGAPIGTAQVLNGAGCSGGNLSPALHWSAAPAGTRSFAVTLYDPDAPTGSGFWHWLVYNLPASTHDLATGAGNPAQASLPAGAVQGVNDFGSNSYSGPCPPQGQSHRYILTVYALNVAVLDVPAGATNALIRFNLHSHTLAQTSLTTRFGR